MPTSPPTSYENIRNAILAIVEDVPGIGNVYAYERFAEDWVKFLKLFKDEETGKINGCMFTRERRGRWQETLGETEKTHIFQFMRFMEVDDENQSGIVFDDHLEALADIFDSDETLGGLCLTVNPDGGEMGGAIGMQIDLIETRALGNTVCHYAELRLCVVETKAN